MQWLEDASTPVVMYLIEATDADLVMLIEGRAPGAFRLPPEGVEQPEVLAMLRDLANSIRPNFSPASWMMIEDGEVVGLCSLVRLPGDDGVDIGYGVSPSRRQRGLATTAVRALLEWGRKDQRVSSIRAETSVSNIASQRVLQNNGFMPVGERLDDEDGDLICWRADTLG